MIKNLRLNWIAFASSAFLVAAILYVLSRRQGVDALIEVWSHIDLAPFLLAVLLMLIVQGISAYRVKTIVNAEELNSIAYWSLLRIQLISQFVAYGAPVSALSDLAKAAMVKLRFNLPLGRSIRIILYERICGALGAVVIGLFATFAQLAIPTPRTLVDVQFLVWCGGLLGGVVIFVLGGLHISTGIAVVDRAANAVVRLGQMLRRPRIAAELLFISLLQLLGFAIIFIILADGLHINVSRPHIVAFMPFIFLVSSLPIFYQGWGGREAVVILTIGGIGTVTGAQAVALSVAFGVAVALSSLPGAVFWMMRPSMRKSVRLEVEQQT
jgi:Lysylphosphatidylglycerol synthase TM region